MSRRPNKTGANGRDPTTGRFVVGNSGGPGRPRGIDFRKVVEEKAAEHDLDLEEAVWEVVQALIDGAKDGDVQAAKLLLDRVCGPVTQEHYIEHGNPPPSNVDAAPKGRDMVEYLRDVANEYEDHLDGYKKKRRRMEEGEG